MAKNFATDRVFSYLLLVNGHLSSIGVNLDDTFGEAFLELFSEMRRNWLCDFDVR